MNVLPWEKMGCNNYLIDEAWCPNAELSSLAPAIYRTFSDLLTAYQKWSSHVDHAQLLYVCMYVLAI
jgi:hypothetical protein